MDDLMIDLNEHRLYGSQVEGMLNTFPPDFRIHIDHIAFIEHCRNAELCVPNEDFIRRQCNEWKYVVLYLLRFNQPDEVIDVLMNHSNDFVELCFKLKRHFNEISCNEPYVEFNGDPDSDVLNAEYVMQKYIGLQNPSQPTPCTKQRLKELSELCMRNLGTINDPTELQKEADLLVVLTRVRAQLCSDNDEAKAIIEEIWDCLPNRVNKYYAYLVYHGRDIVRAAELGDVERVMSYEKELEKLCLLCTGISIMSMYHHRMVYVYRKLYQVTLEEEVKLKALRHCEYGFKYSAVLNTNFVKYFKKFFLMSEILIRLGVNVDYTCIAIEHVFAPDNIREAAEKLDTLGRYYLSTMVPEERLAYFFCRGRISEDSNIQGALGYIQEVIGLQKSLTFPLNQILHHKTRKLRWCMSRSSDLKSENCVNIDPA
ncbi:hypothetical protein DPMN_065521 [Dreissena polymorpha]|uniref:Uncharacterized protein n=1 Tax=Dreissena polymorpha TaxID=45954 RepID=A0A9D4BJP5_DREPO|nr:hypothetical protein DPMN_065521 [Dreissena polymorpha]